VYCENFSHWGTHEKKQYLATKARTFCISRFSSFPLLCERSHVFCKGHGLGPRGGTARWAPYGRIWAEAVMAATTRRERGGVCGARKDNSTHWLPRWNFFKGVPLVYFQKQCKFLHAQLKIKLNSAGWYVGLLISKYTDLGAVNLLKCPLVII